MQVETYEITETGTEGLIENVEETKSLIESLGLEGQKKFLNADKPDQLFPYRRMTAQEELVYDLILGEKTALSRYEEAVIPVRVLQVAAHVTQLGFCREIEVWHKPSVNIKDPLLVGIRGEMWSPERYLLARWGEILLPFEELCVMAKEILIADLKNEFAKEKGELESAGQRIEQIATKAVLSGRKPSFNFLVIGD